MIALVVVAVVVMVGARVIAGRRRRQVASLAADRAQLQPMNEWSARFPPPAQRARAGGRRRRVGSGF